MKGIVLRPSFLKDAKVAWVRPQGLSLCSLLGVLSLTGALVTQSLETKKSWKDIFFLRKKGLFWLTVQGVHSILMGTAGQQELMAEWIRKPRDKRWCSARFLMAPFQPLLDPGLRCGTTHLQGRPFFKF